MESWTKANPDGFDAADGALSVIHSGQVLLPHSCEVRPIHFDNPVLALERGDVPCFTATFQENAGTAPRRALALQRPGLTGAGHIALTKPLARRLREGSVLRVASSLNTLFHLCKLGPGLFKSDRSYDKSATLAVTFASHPSDSRRSRASFVGLPGKCWHHSRGKCWHHSRAPICRAQTVLVAVDSRTRGARALRGARCTRPIEWPRG